MASNKNKPAIPILLLTLSTLHFSDAETATVSTNQFISDGTTLLSNGRVFALGFFSPLHSKRRYVGIWYHNKPSQRVIWVANRETPIENTTGALGIRDGNLVILRGTEPSPIWSTNTNLSTPVRKSHLKISDSGNLVLFHGNHKVWESFDHPTHVWLPGMKYGVDKRTGLSRALASWKSPDDPAAGDFVLKLDMTGLLQFYTYDVIQQKMYLRIGPWSGQGLSGVPEIPNSPYFNFTFVNNEEEIYLVYNPYNTSVLHHFVLDPFGLFQRLTWYERAQRWERGWSVPRDRCDVYGQCGSFGECGFGDELACNCLPGFEPKSPQDWILRDGSNGCVRKRLVCGDGFLKMEHVKLPDTSAAEAILGLGLKECERKCERNCSCSAYAVVDVNKLGTGCVVWYGDLMDMRRYSDGGDDVYVRVDAAEVAGKLNLLAAKQRRYVRIEAIGVSSITLVLVVGVMCYCSIRMRKKNKVKGEKDKDRLSRLLVVVGCLDANHFGEEAEGIELPLFDLDTINAATNNFSCTNKLGEGGFGEVYKGQLCGGKSIAVKKLSASSNQGIDEFKNEVVLMAKLQHRNLVRLLGCCIEGEEKMLVYEYMFNKSLDFFIFDESKRKLLDWIKRFNIIIGTARGILYLHEDSRLKIIHRDLKASNVLLDVEMNPKISDFGVARIFGGNQTHAKTKKVIGTYGYMSPEYAMNGSFSIKSDVFSFGVLLLEIISGTKNKGYYYEDPSSNVVGRAWELWGQGKALELVDSSMVEGSYRVGDVLRCVHVGLLCVQGRAADRPTMRSVVFMLENETAMPRPKLPAYISPAHSATSTCVHDKTVTMIVPR